MLTITVYIIVTMLPASKYKPPSLNRILVIDDLPITSLGFQAIFRRINPFALVEYSENIFSALSSGAYDNTLFDLVITGSLQENFSERLQLAVAGLKKKFGDSRVMIYSSSYDPVIIEKMEAAGIDAYVHRSEPIEEIGRVYCKLVKGERYVSEIFHTLYYEYEQRTRK